ncbi:major facilitator superfamily domain-containing protein [Chaetomium sp. MPI-CAGE-AT-0009]|nr:major facilitator superfamily domain-containing protein [Chaetomium sp. MPI-CAGE-AT-0009]
MSLTQQANVPLPTAENGITNENQHVSADPEQEPLFPRHPNAATSTSNRLLLLIGPALLAGIFVKAFDIAFLATSYSRLASDLQHFKDASWVMLTASICSAIFVPLYSYLLESFGIRRMMFVAYGAFALGLTFCASSTSFWQFLGSRFVVGFGSSGITLLSMIVINEIVGMKQLAIWESFVTCIEMATSMTAGPLGASMYRSLGWHSVFCLELGFSVIGLIVLHFSFTHLRSRPEHSHSMLLKEGDSKVPRIDLGGWVLLSLAVIVPLIALTLGDNLVSWNHPLEISLLICGPILMVLFVLFEAKSAAVPIINMTPIFKIQYLVVLFQVFGVISILNSIVFIIPPYIQVRAFDTPSFEDWALTCVFLGFPPGAILGGYLIKSGTFPVQRMMLANAVFLLCFCVFFLTRLIKPESGQYAPLLAGFGKRWWPQTLALYYLIETFGADLGMALMATITRSVAKAGIRARLQESPATEKIIMDAMRDLNTVSLLDEETRGAVLAAFEHAMHSSFVLPCATAAMVIVLAAAMNFWPRKPDPEEVASADHHAGDS